jgi:hypothetical protein
MAEKRDYQHFKPNPTHSSSQKHVVVTEILDAARRSASSGQTIYLPTNSRLRGILDTTRSESSNF